MSAIQNLIDKIRGKKKNPEWNHKSDIQESAPYEKIYFPYYNLEFPIHNNKPELYNKDGQKMDIFFIRDIHNAHDPYGQRSKYFLWDRFNIGLDTHFYTHNSMLETIGAPKRRYGMLFESEAIVPDDYKIFDKNKGLEKDFDLIFTYSEEILNKIDNARFVPFCAKPWFGTEFGGGEIKESTHEFKNKNISIMSSDKIMCDLHKFRLELANKCKRKNLADTFGTFDGGTHAKVAESLTTYRYSIVIENDTKPLFFTERITNCFASMTIPIYLGAGKIDEFFNPDGIIKISEKDIDNIENILKQCNEKDYEQRLPAIMDNYNRALNYLNIEDMMYEKYLRKA